MNPFLLTDHGVLQRGTPLPFKGTCPAGGAIQIRFRGQSWQTRAGQDGAWRLDIGPFAPGEPACLTLATPDGVLEFRDVLVGDVWVCSGQSNMAMPLRDADGGLADAARSADPGLRFLTVPGRVAPAPVADLGGAAWQACGPETAAPFSALAYYTARALRKAHPDIPLGLISASVGGTPGEAWLPGSVLEGDPIFAPFMERWRQSLAAFPDPGGTYAAAFAQWDREADLAEREGRPIPGAFPKLIGPGHGWTPAGLFNGMIAPLTATPVRGIWWYQGAASPERAFQYRRLFRLLIRAWREAWNLGDIPFIYAQEANFGPRRDEPGEHSWAELREAQAMALAEPRTAMAVAIDLGEATNIHPVRKAPLGERLALAARAVALGDAVPFSGPVYRSHAVEARRIRIRFDHVNGGLATADGRAPVGFAVSGGAVDFARGNRGFEWARAAIQGDELVVESDRVPSPVAVRYAWAQNPDCNLINGVGLPAVPFRTDDWPGVTVANA
jgi:sialate O-acetylesterase